MPKLLLILNRANIGGIVSQVANLYKNLPDSYETHLISGCPEADEASADAWLQAMDIRVTYVPNMQRAISWKKDREAYLFIKNYIRQFQPDIVHTHAAKAGALGRLAAFACNVPVVVHTFHGHAFNHYFGKLKTAFFIKIERHLAKKCSAIIAISALQKKDLTEVYKIAPPQKVPIIELGYDFTKLTENTPQKRQHFRRQYQLDDDVIALGMIGRLAPIKNPSMFLRNFAKVYAQSKQKVKAFLVGDGELRQSLEQEILALGLKYSSAPPFDAPIIFTSWIENVSEVFAGLDGVVLCSLNEGTPVSLLEAQACNKPIVSTDVGGVLDIVVPNETALVSGRSDDEAFYQNLLAVVEKTSLREKLSQNGKKNVWKRFSIDTMVSKHVHLYEQLLAAEKET